ncbi:hypothetical protein ABIA33_003259 [Streptacidiphilus sp. MAP12-16]
MSDDPRAALAAAQYDLVAALVAGAKPPDGFDVARVRVQARALVDKRARHAAAHHPWLAEALAGDYRGVFAAYAGVNPLPPGGGHADAAAFVAYLRGRGELPPGPAPEARGRLIRLLRRRRH